MLRADIAKVAATLSRRKHVIETRRAWEIKSLILKISKEEQFVLDDRSAKGAAKHIPAQFGLSNHGNRHIIRPALRIEDVVAEKLPNIAMVLVCARFDGGIDDSTFKVSELCRRVVGDEVELLDRIRS